MWTASKISAGAVDKMQIKAGLLLNKFDVTNPVEPADEDIIADTTGDYTITATPTTEDFFADVNHAQLNTMEGKHITGWECSLSVTALSITEETLALALGASKTNENGGVSPAVDYRLADYKSVYWIGDMVDENKLFVVVMDNTVSTGGLSYTAASNGKGQLALTLTPHASLESYDTIPMAFYLLEKIATEDPDEV